MNYYQITSYKRWERMEPVNCSKCNKLIRDKSGLKTHERYCDGNGSRKDRVIKKFVCPICNYRIFASYRKHMKSCDGIGPKRIKRELSKKKDRTAWNKGLTKETDERVRKSAINSGKSQKGKPGQKVSKKTRKKLSKIQQERIKNGCKIGAGHAKKYWHDSPIAGKVSLDGTWELRTAIFFDGSELKWRRNTRLFKYNKQDGSIGYYKPDFYVYDWGTYIEVKGWENKDDTLKWSQFPEPLEIWNGDKLVEYGILMSKWQ